MTMDKSQAINAITSVFQRYRRLTPTDPKGSCPHSVRASYTNCTSSPNC